MNNFDSESDFLLSAYSFSVPKEQVAQYPNERGESRLLVLDRYTNQVTHSYFLNLSEYVPANALLVVNNTHVIPARIFCFHNEKQIEFLLLTPILQLESEAIPLQISNELWYMASGEGLIKPSKNVDSGTILSFQQSLKIEVIKKGTNGRHSVTFYWKQSILDLFVTYGHTPLPPYIQRKDTPLDIERYQTIYSRKDKPGSVAAPTAGLHFSSFTCKKLQDKGIKWAELTLHVGYGTFSPVQKADLRQHSMHSEFVEIPEATIKAIQEAKYKKNPVFAVGTTVVRALEGMFSTYGSLRPYTGWINIFISPGYSFNVIDGLVTNFHQPNSTPLILVSTLTGRKRLLTIYNDAITLGYRFFSYGDAMLIK